MKKTLALGVVMLCVAVACGPKAGPGAPGGASPTSPAATPGTPAGVPQATPTSPARTPAAKAKLTIGMMPKLVGIDYFKAAHRGAEEAAKELGVTLKYDGPMENNAEQQSQMIDTWVAQKVDAIAVSPNDPEAIVPALERARKRGIKVLTWDSDADPRGRDLFVNQCTAKSIAHSLMDLMAQNVGPAAKYVIITGSLTAANQNIWMADMEKYRREKYPNMVNLSPGQPKAAEEDAARATEVASDVLKAYPDVQGIFALTSVALPGAAEALEKANASGKVFLTGLSTPKRMKPYVENGTVKKFVLWNAVDLGYLTVYAAAAAVRGELKPGDKTFTAGRLGTVKLIGDQVILGPPLVFDKHNIDKYNF